MKYSRPGDEVKALLLARLAVKRARAKRQQAQDLAVRAPETDWRAWLSTCFPSFFTAPFAPHHEEFWEHVWAIKPELRPRPLIAAWPRGGGKSSSTEPATIALGVHGRKYALYISGSQEQADKHVESIGGILESPDFAARYPKLANRMVSKYGHSKGWRRNRLITEAGYTIDAGGLDTAIRGLKREAARPDVIIFDDIDDILDSPQTVQRKITVLTHSILPAGSPDVAIIGVQNLVHADSIFRQLTNGTADFLLSRLVSGPIPAIHGLTYERQDERYVIRGGTPSWVGQDLAACQAIMNDDGLSSFLIEHQHEVDRYEGGMYGHIVWQHCTWAEMPTFARVVVWVDPAVTHTDHSDAHGIQADGLGVDGRLYRLYSWEARTSPEDVICRAIMKALELKADCVGVETDQGGDVWRSTYREAARTLATMDASTLAPDHWLWHYPETTWRQAATPPEFRSAKAGEGHGSKAHRQGQMLAAYERGEIVHVIGTHEPLERGLRRFGVRKPFDLADAAYWSWFDLCGRRRWLPVDW